MKKCPFCDADIEDSARFCLYCMESLTKKAQIRPRRKKKAPWWLIIASVLVLLISAFFLLWKLPETVTDSHVHKFTMKTPATVYLMAEADCNYPATYYYSCACGKKGTRTFNYGKPNGHTKVVAPAVSAGCVTAGSTEYVKCADCDYVFAVAAPLPAKGHTFVLGDSPSLCTTCGETATITLNLPQFPYNLNDSISIDNGTYQFLPSADGRYRVRLTLTCTNISSTSESYMLAFYLGDMISSHVAGTLASQESRVITITNYVSDPNGTYDLVFVEDLT